MRVGGVGTHYDRGASSVVVTLGFAILTTHRWFQTLQSGDLGSTALDGQDRPRPQCSRNVAVDQGKGVALFSLEMSKWRSLTG
jgi:hypothetical protein